MENLNIHQKINVRSYFNSLEGESFLRVKRPTLVNQSNFDQTEQPFFAENCVRLTGWKKSTLRNLKK
jgi:hypothetical protein